MTMDEEWKARLKDKTRADLIRVIEELVSERDAVKQEILSTREALMELEFRMRGLEK